ncbi:MAG: cation:proton antiporter [Ruminiclostridium sp.]
MEEYKYLFDLAIILLSTKLLGLVTKKIRMPQVVGALCAGLILGPAFGLNILSETDFITRLSEIGVIILMFTAGLETDIKELKKTGLASFVIALLGVIVPLAGGFGLAVIFNEGSESLNTTPFLQNIFIGIILTATSVSITVETLKELGKLSTKSGNAILGAALIDDILGIIALTVVTSLADPEVEIWVVLVKIVAFFIFAIGVGFIVHWGYKKWTTNDKADLRRYTIIAFVICLLMSFVAEQYFGVADITGAFIAGMLISNTQRTKYIAAKFETLSYLLLSPIFFASIGLKVVLPSMSTSIIIFTIALTVFAVLSKIVGCGLGAKICGFKNKDCLRVGVGMVSRGEVALIVASKGAAVGLMNPTLFGPIVIMVVATTIVTPILLKLVYRSKKKSEAPEVEADVVKSELVENSTQAFEDEVQEYARVREKYW